MDAMKVVAAVLGVCVGLAGALVVPAGWGDSEVVEVWACFSVFVSLLAGEGVVCDRVESVLEARKP